MGSTNFSILIPKHFVICGIMNKLVTLEPKRQHNSMLLILHLIFNKLHASPKALILILNPSYKMSNLNLPLVGWGNFCQVPQLIVVETFGPSNKSFFVFFLWVLSLTTCWTSFTFTFHCSCCYYWVLHLCAWLHFSTPFASYDDGHRLSYTTPTSSNHNKSLKCLLVRRLMFEPTTLGLPRKPISLWIPPSKE
jgi:hypothetical protein